MSSASSGGHASAGHHVMPVRLYVMIWLALVVGTAITVVVAYQNLGPLNNLVAMGIAGTKAALVILYFMHAKYSTKLTKTVIACAFIWLVIMIAFTMMDFDSRDWMGVPGK